MLKGIPTPQDEGMLMQAATTQTASMNTAGFDNGSGFAPGGIGMPAAAVVDASALDLTSGDETYSVKLQESDDNATWFDAGAPAPVTAVGVMVAKGFLTKRYTRIALTAGGTTPSITFKAYLNLLMQR